MADSADVAFPFPTALSLEGLIAFWQQLSQNPKSPLAREAAVLLERVEATPAIRGRISDESILADHQELVGALMSAVFPMADPDALGGAGQPFGFTNIFETSAALGTGVFTENAFLNGTTHTDKLMRQGQMIAAYQEVLGKTYGIDADLDYPLLISVEAENGAIRRHYQIWWDSRFLEVRPLGQLPQPSAEDFRRLLAEPTNLDLWVQMLPPERFELGGLGIVRGTDVTMREAVSRLKDDLLEPDAMAASNVDRWQTRIRTLLGAPEVQVGLIGFEHTKDFDAIEDSFAVGRSLLLSKGVIPECSQRGESNYADAFRSGEAVVVTDLEHGDLKSGFEYHLVQSGFKSLLIQPLFMDGRLIGLLEVASPNAGKLTAFSSFKLGEVAQPFATALARSLGERDDRIQSVIKQQYTAIHPALEWRFREAASRWLKGKRDGSAEQIVFREVYPMYGLTDIRGSSNTRGAAIQADLVEQLQLALAVVRAAGNRPAFPIFEQIAYRIEKILGRIEAGLHAEDESVAIGFLSRELEPLLDQLREWGPDVAVPVDAYRMALDDNLGVLYRRRRDFDDSVAKFNDTISQVLNEEEAAAQSVFPHFFEKFQTDGVDYNLYVGDSLTESGGFSKLYLHNLRLWQLKVVCRIEWAINGIRPTLGVDLAPTQLVLVQDQPLAIRFRIDEKRFDVDGAYNIRYELVKKRIDKAHIRGTGERLTQPGYLAVVYSHTHEAQEYRRYLEYLVSAGYYSGEIEDHDLEDMQGVLGLRALRVAINANAPQEVRTQSSAVRPEELAEVGVS